MADLNISSLNNQDFTSLMATGIDAGIIRGAFYVSMILSTVRREKDLSDSQRGIINRDGRDALKRISYKLRSGVIKKTEKGGFVYDRALNKKLWDDRKEAKN